MGGWGSFAGGVSEGLSAGQQQFASWRQLQQLQTAKRALEDRQKALIAQMQGPASPQAPGGQPPGAGPPPATAQPSGPNLGPPAQPTIGDAGPAGPPGPPMGGAGNGGGLGALQAAQGGAANPMAPAVQNPAATAPPPPPGGMTLPAQPTPAQPQQTGQGDGSGGAGFDMRQVVQEYQQIEQLTKKAYQDTAREIFQANPGKKWRKTEFITAVNDEFKQREGLDPDLKQAILAESSAARSRLQWMEANRRETQGDRRLEQGDRRLGDTESKNAFDEAYKTAGLKERQQMDAWRQRHGDQTEQDLQGYRAWSEQHGDTMAGIAQGRLNKAADNSAGGGAGNARVARILNGNPVGKNYLQAHTFKNQIDALADDPGTATNPAAQLDLIDAAVRQASGGVARKAQFDAIAKRNGFTDFLAMHSFLADGRGIIGPKLIEDIRKSADEQADAAMAAGRKMFPSETAQLEGRSPAGGGAGGSPGSSHENPIKPKTKQEASALSSGTWFMDPAGNVIQRK